MANSYRYVQRYRPSTRNRIPDVVAFVETTLPRLGNPLLFDSADNQIICIEEAITELIKRARKTIPAGLGATLNLFAGADSDENVCRYDICIGTSPGQIFIDFLGIQFGRKILPFNDIDTFQSILSIGDPFEGFLSENNNVFSLDTKLRQNRIPAFSLPAVIHGVHFLGRDLVENLGGIGKCLDVPAHSVERFRDGVIIRLAPGIFDPNDMKQLALQEAAIKYFGI